MTERPQVQHEETLPASNIERMFDVSFFIFFNAAVAPNDPHTHAYTYEGTES